jgi:hypothetical protein
MKFIVAFCLFLGAQASAPINPIKLTMADFKQTTFNNKIDHFTDSNVDDGKEEWVNEDIWETETKTYK